MSDLKPTAPLCALYENLKNTPGVEYTMSHELQILLTPTEREQARQIWDLLGQDDGLSGFEALEAVSERVRMAISVVAESPPTNSESEENPFL
jgi:hypothetical protein